MEQALGQVEQDPPREAARFTLTLRSDRLNAVEIARIIHLTAHAATPDESATSSSLPSGLTS